MTTNRRLVRVIRHVAALIASDIGLLREIQSVIADIEPRVPAALDEPQSNDGVVRTAQADASDTDLAQIAGRCRLKADGSRWAAQRLRLKLAGADHQVEIAPTDRAILERAKDACCRLWMNSPSAPVPEDPSHYEVLGACFDALASVLTLPATSHEALTLHDDLLIETLRLAAEAQSALREAIRRAGGASDPDQVDAFWWVRQSAAGIKQYLGRHMREDDPADPTRWMDLQHRIDDLSQRIQQADAASKTRRRLFQKLRYQLEQATAGDDLSLWASVARTVDEVVTAGIPPSNVELRSLLLPHVEIVPPLPESPKGFELAIRELARFRATIGNDADDEDIAECIPVIEAAAEMVQGRSVVLIGGDARPDRQRALEKALRLSELIWVATKHGQSVSTFEPSIARPNVAVVLLAIRWASHDFTDVRHICRSHDKPLVRLPGGYGPNQVAAQILNQCSWRLKKQRSQRAS